MTWICLVDDEPDVRDVLTDLLRGAGHGVQGFRDGSDALEAIESALEDPKLVILDLSLPHMSGQEVLRRIRAGRRAPQVPVLIVTGTELDPAELQTLGVAGVLRKPVAVEPLLAAVAAAIRPRRRKR